MTDNLEGCSLSVLECRALLRHAGIPIGIWSRAMHKLEHGARKELPKETRDRLESTIGSITLEEINDISD